MRLLLPERKRKYISQDYRARMGEGEKKDTRQKKKKILAPCPFPSLPAASFPYTY